MLDKRAPRLFIQTNVEGKERDRENQKKGEDRREEVKNKDKPMKRCERHRSSINLLLQEISCQKTKFSIARVK